MMKQATGIIVEYNPLHNGHLHHLKEVRKMAPNDYIVAVMSGNYVQRGTPSIIDKWTKTKYALESGVDLIIELPTPFVLQSAETFAKVAIHLLDLMGVHQIIYGSESLKKPKLQPIDQQQLKKGYSYAASKNKQHLRSNEILGAYYEHYAHFYGIKTQRILRTNAYHDLNISENIASATAIRHAFLKNKDYKHTTPVDLGKYQTYHLEDYYTLIRYQIISEQNELKKYLLVDEGIENLFIKLAFKHDTLEAFLQEAISKRYTRSRIQRTLMHILLKTPKELPLPNQIRILGMNEKGRSYLNQNKNQIPITAFKDYVLKDYEYIASMIYGLPYQKENQLLALEVGPPVII